MHVSTIAAYAPAAIEPRDSSVRARAATRSPTFQSIYDDHARFVWRALVRLGVANADVADVVQEVFLVVHRRLHEFREESTPRTWVYGIAVRMARNYRRTQVRRPTAVSETDGAEQVTRLPEAPERGPDALLARARAAELVIRLLQELDQDSREVFVLAELEEMTAVEIADVLALNPNTVASRLRSARRLFDQAVRRSRARDQWRLR